MQFSRFATSLIVLGLVGCTTPAGLDTSMKGFADAAAKTEQALQDYDKAVAARLTQVRQSDAIDNPRRVRVLNDDCLTSSTKCEVYLIAGPGAGSEPLLVTTILPNHLAAAREISLYGKALQEIAAADSISAVKGAFDQATATAVSLANLAGHPETAPMIKAFAAPISGVFTWLYQQYQDSTKLKALRDATRQMEEVMQVAIPIFATAPSYATLLDKTRLANAFDAAHDGFKDKTRPSEADLAKLLGTAQQLDTVLKADPARVFAQMGTAHSALAEALRTDDITLAEALRQIEHLLTQAHTLAAIAKEFEAAVAAVKEN